MEYKKVGRKLRDLLEKSKHGFFSGYSQDEQGRLQKEEAFVREYDGKNLNELAAKYRFTVSEARKLIAEHPAVTGPVIPVIASIKCRKKKGSSKNDS